MVFRRAGMKSNYQTLRSRNFHPGLHGQKRRENLANYPPRRNFQFLRGGKHSIVQGGDEFHPIVMRDRQMQGIRAAQLGGKVGDVLMRKIEVIAARDQHN